MCGFGAWNKGMQGIATAQPSGLASIFFECEITQTIMLDIAH